VLKLVKLLILIARQGIHITRKMILGDKFARQGNNVNREMIIEH
jgi:hypothetical protein